MIQLILKDSLQILIGFAVTWIPFMIVFKLAAYVERRSSGRYKKKYGKLPPL